MALTKAQEIKKGKRNKRNGAIWERNVRAELEQQGWTVSKWMNNIRFEESMYYDLDLSRLVPAKHQFRGKGIPMAIGTGFPDFIAFRLPRGLLNKDLTPSNDLYEVIGVECKMNGYLDKEEKEKCQWLLKNNIFSKVLVASKVKEGRKNKIKFTTIKLL